MAADVEASVKQNSTLSVGCVQDGAPQMWNQARAGLRELQPRGVIAGWEEGSDRYHLLERLAKALDSAEPIAAERNRQLTDWKQRLDRRGSAIESIECVLKSADRAFCKADHERAGRLSEHLVYIANNKDRMRYVTLPIKSLPIGSGVTEASAKTVIGKRANGSGQRWRTPGLRGVLTLRAIHQSDRLPRFWNRFSGGYTGTVQEAV